MCAPILMMAVVCECNVYTLCGMRPVDLRFFAYVYNVYNRKADVCVAVLVLLFFLCLYVVCLLAALVARSLALTFSDDIFPTNMCTSRSICWPPVSVGREFYCGKARADRASSYSIVNTIYAGVIVSIALPCLTLLCLHSSFNLFADESRYTLCFCKHWYMLFVIRPSAFLFLFVVFCPLVSKSQKMPIIMSNKRPHTVHTRTVCVRESIDFSWNVFHSNSIPMLLFRLSHGV